MSNVYLCIFKVFSTIAKQHHFTLQSHFSMKSVRVRTPAADIQTTVEAPSDGHVSDIIESLSKQQGYNEQTTRLVLRGQVVKKDCNIAQLNIKENDVLVVVGSKNNNNNNEEQKGEITNQDGEDMRAESVENFFPRLLNLGYSKEQINDALEKLPLNPSLSQLVSQLDKCKMESLLSLLVQRGYNENQIKTVLASQPSDVKLSTVTQILDSMQATNPAEQSVECKVDELLKKGFNSDLLNDVFMLQHYRDMPLPELEEDLNIIEGMLEENHSLPEILKTLQECPVPEEGCKENLIRLLLSETLPAEPPPPPSTSREDVLNELIVNQGFDKLIVTQIVDSSPESTPMSSLVSLIEEEVSRQQLHHKQQHLINNLGFDETLVMNLTDGAHGTSVDDLVALLEMALSAPSRGEHSNSTPFPQQSDDAVEVCFCIALTCEGEKKKKKTESVLNDGRDV